jgi:DNA repair exonuclease SbcCD ATPase subunit
MRINEDYLDQNIEDTLDDSESVKDERELKYQFRIVSRGDYSNHLNTEESFRRSLDLVASKTPNVLEYKITSIALQTEEKDNSISITPTFVQHRDSQDFIADFQMDIRKFSTLSSLYRFLAMIHDTVRYKSGDDVDLYLKLDTSTDSSDSVEYIFQWYLLACLVNHSIEGYSRCHYAMNSFRRFAEALTSIPEERLNKEIIDLENAMQAQAEKNESLRQKMAVADQEAAKLQERQDQSDGIRDRILERRQELNHEIAEAIAEMTRLAEQQKQQKQDLALLDEFLTKEQAKQKDYSQRIRTLEEQSQAVNKEKEAQFAVWTAKQQELALAERDLENGADGQEGRESELQQAREKLQQWQKLQAELQNQVVLIHYGCATYQNK